MVETIRQLNMYQKIINLIYDSYKNTLPKNQIFFNIGEKKEVLPSKKYSPNSFQEYFNKIFPKINNENNSELRNSESRNSEMAMKIINIQPGYDMFPGTWWNAYNTVSFMTDHVLGRNILTRLESAWYGVNQKKKHTALNLAKEMANVS